MRRKYHEKVINFEIVSILMKLSVHENNVA